MKNAAALLTALLLCAGAAFAAPAAPFLDLGFETGCLGGWRLNGRDFDYAFDAAKPATGHRSLRIRYAGHDPWKNGGMGSAAGAQQDFPVAAATGHKIRFSGLLRTEKVEHGYAGLWLRVDGEKGQVGFDNMMNRGVHGTTPWTRYQIELDVPGDAKGIVFGALLAGDGSVWADDLRFEIDGKPWTEGPATRPAPPSKAAVAWLRGHAIPIATVATGPSRDDLKPLAKVIGDARVVALGEATHGTHEFFRLKSRLIDFLARDMGFTLFAIEANQPEADRLNRYVLTGEGDPAKLLEGLYFWTWDTREVLDLILWMRELNRSGQGHMQFLGFDMQVAGVAESDVRDFVARAEPGYAAALDEAWKQVEAPEHLPAESGSPEIMAAAQKSIEAAHGVLAHLQEARARYLESMPREEVERAIHNAQIVVQKTEWDIGQGSRDESMARNVEWIVDQAPPGSKIVLWAHNEHVSRQPKRMGSYLAERFGKEMVVMGFAFHEGRYNAMGPEGLGPHDAPPSVAGSVDAYLHAAGLPILALDLRSVAGTAGSPAAPWLAAERPLRSIGAFATRCDAAPAVPARLFDVLLFVDRTTPSELLPKG